MSNVLSVNFKQSAQPVAQTEVGAITSNPVCRPTPEQAKATAWSWVEGESMHFGPKNTSPDGYAEATEIELHELHIHADRQTRSGRPVELILQVNVTMQGKRGWLELKARAGASGRDVKLGPSGSMGRSHGCVLAGFVDWIRGKVADFVEATEVEAWSTQLDNLMARMSAKGFGVDAVKQRQQQITRYLNTRTGTLEALGDDSTESRVYLDVDSELYRYLASELHIYTRENTSAGVIMLGDCTLGSLLDLEALFGHALSESNRSSSGIQAVYVRQALAS